jgi:hypothetical protein
MDDGWHLADHYHMGKATTKRTPDSRHSLEAARKFAPEFIDSANSLTVMHNDMIVPTLNIPDEYCCIGRARQADLSTMCVKATYHPRT